MRGPPLFGSGGLNSKRNLVVELSGAMRGGAGPTPSRSPSYPRNALWGAWARAGESANARELMGAARGASWKRRKSLGRAWDPCGLVSTPRRARGLSRGACRCVETGLALNPELMLGTSRLRYKTKKPLPFFKKSKKMGGALAGRGLSVSACRCVGTDFTLYPRTHAAAIELR